MADAIMTGGEHETGADQAEVGGNLDLTSESPLESRVRPGAHEPRDFVGIRFACCEVYVRVYLAGRSEDQTVRCPRCLRVVRLRFGTQGSTARFFEAS